MVNVYVRFVYNSDLYPRDEQREFSVGVVGAYDFKRPDLHFYNPSY